MTASELRSSFPTSFLLRVKEARKKHVVESSMASSVNVAVRPSSSKNIKYLLDLLTFAVETGRLTESCGRILTALLRDRNSTLLKLPLSPGDDNKPHDQELIEDDVEEELEQLKDVLDNSSRSCAGSWCGPTDNDVVLRDVHFRKLYSGDGVRAVASGSTPLDLPCRESCSRPAAYSSSRQLRALKCCSDSNRPGALEDLLTRHEKLLGTPLSEVRRAVELKASLVRRLVLCVEQANSLSSSRMAPTPASPPSRRKELYLRLVRALDQRVPPDQRLLPVRKAQSKKKSAPGATTQAPPAWFFALQQVPRVGSKLFAQESRLSDYMHD